MSQDPRVQHDVTRRATTALNGDEARYRFLFEAIDTGFCTIQVVFDERGKATDYVFLEVNPAFISHTGLVDAVRKSIRELRPEHEDYWFETYGRIVTTGRPERFERLSPSLGRWFDVYAFPIGPPERQELAIRLYDITDRKRAEDALRVTAERLRHVVDGAREYAIISLDADGRITGWDGGARRLLGYDEAETLGLPIDIFYTPEDCASGVPEREMRTADESGRASDDRWHLRKDGSRFWGSGVMLPLHDGDSARFLKIFRDRTEERQAAELQRLLLSELEHRVKNTLAVVDAIATQTFRGLDQEAEKAFRSRLRALAGGHGVLTQEHWQGADLRQVVATALKPFNDETRARLRIEGPGLEIAAKPALALTLALHELATNAAKYGALASENGRVDVSWSVEDGLEGRLRFQWVEREGPPVAVPAKTGFGSRLIRNLSTELGATVQIDYPPSGAVCVVDVPTASLQDQANGGEPAT
ncbi:sensor histidine kinase [Flaviflagellibacter deserti]|uniref:Blue-light-activated histidine kinase n=1 Tax=Flaviflagellibacter deserti TaxID=2267266 RepID=A0ABV9Z4G1_9HYPH